MKKNWIAAGLGLGIIVGAAALAYAQTISIPTVQAIGPNDLFQDIVGGSPVVGNIYATAPQLGNYTATLPGNNAENALVGGDATTNLFQRTTSVGIASPGTLAYTADRWVAWGGTNAPVTVSKQTGAADITAGYGASFRVNKPSGAGVVQICVGQEIESVNSYRFQGVPAQFVMHTKAGPTFSAAASNLAFYILTGTGTDEGTSNGAFSINGGGGSSTPWTGASLLGGTNGYLIPITTGWGRYGVAAPIPSTATEIMVAACWTPVGTGSATDWFEFVGAMLVPDSSLTAFAGTAGAIFNPNDSRMKSFLRRPQELETILQQRYTWLAATEAASTALVYGSCSGTATTTAHCYLPFPVPMRAAPASTFGTLTAGTLVADVETSGAADTVTALALTANASTVSGADITLTFAGSAVAGQTGRLRGGNSTGGGLILLSSEL